MDAARPKIWIVTELFPPDETSTAYIMGEIANAMTSKYQVEVICGPEIYDERRFIDQNNTFKLHPSIHVHRVKGVGGKKNTLIGKLLAFIFITKRIYSICRNNIRTTDKVLMVTNPASLVVAMASLKRRVGFEFNILVHDIFPENTKPAGIKLPFYTVIKKLFDKAYSRADMLIAIGRDMVNVLNVKVCQYNPQIRIEIIENWADIVNIKPRPFPDGQIRIQYAGNIGRVQGFDKVIAALPMNIQLHMYGTGAMEDKLKNMQYRNVFFHGAYARSQQNDILGECHIALVTLEQGMYGLGVPSKTYNILAAGRPILFLGPKCSEVDMLVREYGIGYCEWPDVWDVDTLVEMGSRARILAERNYSKEIILQKFLNII